MKLAFFLSAALYAQSFTGSILGTVKDASGAVVPNAQIAVTNVDTNLRANETTSADGFYRANNLPPGNYRIEVTASGFKKAVRESLNLAITQQLQVDVALTVGEVADSITVEATAVALETTTSSLGKVVENKRIVNLPLNTRNVYSLIFLTPGVAGAIGNSYGEMRYSVNGARARMMDTLIDGVTASHSTVNGLSGGISVFPSVDAIEEFKVMGSNYSAEYGRSMGSVLNVAFKSGTNTLHGSVYEFLRNSVMDSNNFFDNRSGRALSSFKRSQFGYVAQGPIKKDKLFFMTSLEGLRARTFARRAFTAPTDLERQGNFSQTFNVVNNQPALIRIFDPFSTRRDPSGTAFIRDPFPSNTVPAARFDPVASNVSKFYPQPNTGGAAITNQNNFAQSGSGQGNILQHDYRVDYQIDSHQRIFGRYSTRLNENVPLKSFPDDLTIAEGRIVDEDHVHGGVADYTNTLSGSTILNVRLGFARTLYVFNNQSIGFRPSSLGLPAGYDIGPDFQLFPGFSVAGQVGLGGGDHRRNAFMSYTTLANLTKIMGRHSIKTGFEGRLLRVNTNEARSAGDFSFGAGMTQGPNPNQASPTAGIGLASFLLGTGSGGSLIQNFKNVATQSFYYSGYLQDDWRINSKLTINLGLRWDIDTPRSERFDRTNYFDPSIASPLASTVPNLRGGLVFVGTNGQPRTQFPRDLNNFAPRIGFAYSVNSKTVLRAGYGHLYGAGFQAAAGTIGTQGFRTDNTWVASIDGITPNNLLRNPYPNGFRQPPKASQGLLTQVGNSIEAATQDMLTNWNRQVNVNLQRELPFGMLLEAAYVHTRGFHLFRNTEGGLTLNQLPKEAMALGAALNEQVANPFFGTAGAAGILANRTVRRAQLLRPFPQFDTIVPIYSSGASNFYHSLQITMTKRFSRGLMFEGSYTWAKNLDDGQSHQDSYNLRDDRALSDIDLKHRFVMSYIYELPFGRGRKLGSNWSRWLDLAAGQWQFNGITTYQSGTPLGPSASNTAGIFNSTIRANNNGRSPRLEGKVDQRLNRYFDTSVFSQPPAFTFGNASQRIDALRNDIIQNYDLSLFKDFVLKQRESGNVRAQFRAEALNAFNTPRFGSPNTSVTSSAVGTINGQANAPRQMQLGLKILW
ncbi:MAG: hypothetical protein FJW30_27050 [Acidobacteria bacterium]|nr:hypothetical protein [Acidobacteriota bacterium]